jgi:hypothetical protein
LRRRPPPPRAHSLSVPPSPLVSSSSTSHPRSPRRGRAHDRAFSGHVRAPAPLLSSRPARPPLLSHLCPLPNPFALSLALPTCAASSATACHRQLPVLWSPSRQCPIQCHVSSALLSAARDTLRCALFPPAASSPRSPEFPLCSRSSTTVAPSSPCASAVASRPSASAQGEQHVCALNLAIAALFSARLFAGVAPRLR